MPGFVDVSNWSDQDIKRLGQRDDDDFAISSNRHRPRGLTQVGYAISDVWAAACAANRVNGGYFKECVFEYTDGEPPKMVKDKNRHIMMHFLANPDQLLVEDVEAGEQCRKFLENDITFRTLKNTTNDFDRSVRQVLAVQDHFNDIGNRYELAVVACLPASWQRAVARQSKDERIAEARGGFVGEVGTAVQLNIEVLGSVKSKDFDIYWVTAITDADQAISFSNKESWDVGTHLTIKGKVKAHRTNLTQLNYVKVL